MLGFDPEHGERAFRERIGVVLQSSELWPNLTVRETHAMFAAYYRAPRDVDEVIELVGLTEKRDARGKTLSGGQKRRLDLGVALVGDPELLFLDEPTTGFDPTARRAAWEMIRSLRLLGKTVLLTTHYLDEAQELADRVAVVRAGEILTLGTPAELRAVSGETEIRYRDDGREVVLTTTEPTRTLHELTAQAVAEGRELEGLEVRRPTLEDVYLTLLEATGWPSTLARISTPSPCSSIHGARMKTARTGSPSRSGKRSSSSKECTWRPKALRRATMSMIPRCSRSSMMSPAHVPNIGTPEAASSRSGSARPSRSIPSVIVVDSPPGRTSPSSPSRSAGTRTSRTSAPSERRTSRVRGEPALEGEDADDGLSPAAAGERLLGLELARLEALHRGAEALRRAGDAVGIGEVRRRLDDRRGAGRRVLGLEDPGAHEDRLRAELHHERRVGGRRDAAGAEQRDGQLALAAPCGARGRRTTAAPWRR